LQERALLYRDRDGADVEKLRAYLVLVLVDLGEGKAIWPNVLELLANGHSPYTHAVGARAASRLGPFAAGAVPYLLAALGPHWHDEVFSLERFDVDYPTEETTSSCRESVRALGRIGEKARVAVAALRQLLAREAAWSLAPQEEAGTTPPPLEQEIRLALRQIEGGQGP
jgi:hypothetical protein